MVLTLLAALAATLAPQARVRATARILSSVRVGPAVASAAATTTTRIVRDPATGAPLRIVEFQ